MGVDSTQSDCHLSVLGAGEPPGLPRIGFAVGPRRIFCLCVPGVQNVIE